MVSPRRTSHSPGAGVPVQTSSSLRSDNGTQTSAMIYSLGILVKKIREKQMQVIIDRLVEYISSKEEELRDIASLGTYACSFQASGSKP